jgi:hypothetical protein
MKGEFKLNNDDDAIRFAYALLIELEMMSECEYDTDAIIKTWFDVHVASGHFKTIMNRYASDTDDVFEPVCAVYADMSSPSVIVPFSDHIVTQLIQSSKWTEMNNRDIQCITECGDAQCVYSEHGDIDDFIHPITSIMLHLVSSLTWT